jgi:hypothetical protein
MSDIFLGAHTPPKLGERSGWLPFLLCNPEVLKVPLNTPNPISNQILKYRARNLLRK